MKCTHTRTFRVRYHECDGLGHLNHANYLRYMQEAAFDATAAAGYDIGRYQAMGRYWLAHRTDIEYLHPLRYGDRVQVRTWVTGFRRVQCRRVYEFRLDESDSLVARARTDWVLMDNATTRPVPVPPEMAAAFLPEGTQPPPPLRIPPASPPPPGTFRIQRRVEWRDINPAQHVNNATYLIYVEDCGMQVAGAFGWPLERMLDQGFAIIARQHQIEYLRPAVLDDVLEVATWFSDNRRATAIRHTTVRHVNDGTLLARARTRWVWVDVKTGRPIRIPEGFIEDFAPNRSEGSS